MITVDNPAQKKTLILQLYNIYTFSSNNSFQQVIYEYYCASINSAFKDEKKQILPSGNL